MIEIPVGYPLLLCYQNDTISSNLFILHQPDKLLRGPPLQTPAQDCRQKIAVMVIPVGIVVGKLQDRLLTVFVVDKGFRSEEHTSELQSCGHIVCCLLLTKQNIN